MVSMIKKALYIDVGRKEYEMRTYPDLGVYIGGVSLSTKLLSMYYDDDPVVFSVGPLNGFFPFASKTSATFLEGGVVEDVYLGGSLSFRIRFSGIDSIIIVGIAKEPIVIEITDDSVLFKSDKTLPDALGLPGKKSVMEVKDGILLLDNYFGSPDNLLGKKITEKKIKALVVSGTKNFEVKNKERYEELFQKILDRTSELEVGKDFFPSCSGCPMGCAFSKVGEIGGDILIHSLVACSFAGKIYSDVGTVFSCLNVLGLDYTHEDIENLPGLVNKILEDLE